MRTCARAIKIKAAADKFPFVFIAAKQKGKNFEIEIIQEGEIK